MTVDCGDTDPIPKVASSGKVFDRGCGFLTEANCSLTEIEGPWWILDAKIQRPADRGGTYGLRIRIEGREVHLDGTDAVAGGIVHLRHLLKLPMGDCTIRLDWIEEGMSTQQILQKECHVKGGSRIAQEKILAHPVDGQTDMTVMPKYGFWRQLEKKIRNYRKVISAKFNKKYKQNNPRKVKHLVFSSELNRKSLGRKLYVDITPIMENARADGVACVTKAVLSRILGSHEHGFEVIPVYSAEKGGGYFQAQFAAEKKNKWEMTAQRNPAIEPQDGDIFLGLGLNQRGVCDHLSLLLRWADQGVSILFYVYDLLPIQYPHFWPLEAQSDILHHEWLSIVTAFDEVICISETTARRCREFMDEKYAPRFRYKNRLNRSPVHLPSKKAKISSIPLGSDFDAELQSRGLPENAEGLLANFRSKRTFLMVGTLEPRKAHAQILQAFDQMWAKGSEDQLVIVGREGWLMHDFVQQLKSHRLLGSKLFWFRDASDEYLKRIYNASTCLIAASYDEGFGLPLVEAARFGKPIIARDIEIHREVAGRNALYFKGCDIEEIYHKIEEWEKLYNADQHPKSNIDSRTWEQHAEQLVENIKILVKERSRAKTVIINGFIRSLDPTEGIQRAMASGTYEPAQTDWVRSILQTGARFVDVGASFGYYTSLASRIVGPTGRVFAFQPSPVAYKSLVEMISDNQIENIEVYHAAAGDRDGKVDILLPPNGELHSPSIFDCGSGFTPHSVPLVRLDSHAALADGVPIDLIKIDVEGFEPNVIEGLRGLISRGLVRMIMLEFNSGWLRRNGGMTPERLLKMILGLRFVVVARTEKVVGIERDGVTPYELQDILFRLESWKHAESNVV